LLAGCAADQPANQANAAASSSREAIAGYRNISFGRTFAEAVAEIGASNFNSISIAECPGEMPLRGCFLSPNHERTAPFEMRDGIPYFLDLSFNRRDRLTDIGLSYRREGAISSQQCREIHGRTLDWLIEDFGPFREGSQPLSTGWRNEQVRTAAGHTFSVGVAPDGDHVSALMRTAPASRFNPASSITTWDDQRYVSLMSSFIRVNGRPHCHVTVGVHEPRSIERRPMDPPPNR
jgi:hypothetical protein